MGLCAKANSDEYSDTGTVLSLDGIRGARRLARVFLADPLASESPWELRLLEQEGNDERPLLLRCANLGYRNRIPNLCMKIRREGRL